MPSATPLLLSMPATHTTTEKVEEVLLGLPSDIPPESREVACTSSLGDMEADLRDAQCRDALQELRNQLHVKQRLYTYKKLHVRHQGASTRARTDLATQDVRINSAAEKYRRARRALLSLRGHGEWETEFCVLEDKDIRNVQEDDPEAVRARRRREKDTGESEGRRVVSWIWRASDARGDAGVVESLRVEWCKMRARVKRWKEEIRLVPEEMRRVLAFLEWQEAQWITRMERRCDVDAALREGLVAYAIDQAQTRRAMRREFRDQWVGIASVVGLGTGPEWEPVLGVRGSEGVRRSSEVDSDRELYQLYLESQHQEEQDPEIPEWV